MQLTLPLFDLELKPTLRQCKKRSHLRPFPFPLGEADKAFLLDRDADHSLYDDPERAGQGLPRPLCLIAGVGDCVWNGWPTLAGPFVCVSPIRGRTTRTQKETQVSLSPYTLVIVDSGAFSRQCAPGEQGQRPSHAETLQGQYTHMAKYGYADQVIGIGSDDIIIDETWLPDTGGGQRRVKRRWSEQQAIWAMEETVKAAAFLHGHRNGIPLILNLQGITPQQYLDCARRVVPFLREGDYIGLGGWCATGRFPKRIMPVFIATMELLIPFLAANGVKKVHLWGVCHAPALGILLWLCDRYHIELSTDSARPALRPAFGEWGYADWRMADYDQPPLHLPKECCQAGNIEDLFEAEDPVLRMHYLLMHDEEYAEMFRDQEEMAWLFDPECIEIYRQAALETLLAQVYGKVSGYDGKLYSVIRAQGAYRIEHTYQVRYWLAHLHKTPWYGPPDNYQHRNSNSQGSKLTLKNKIKRG